MTNRKPLVHRELNAEEAQRLNPDLTPKGSTDAERAEAVIVLPYPPKEKQMEPVVSPTGAPVVSGQAVLLKVAAILVVIATAVAAKAPDLFPGTEVDQQVAQILVGLGAFFGIVSPGVRK